MAALSAMPTAASGASPAGAAPPTQCPRRAAIPLARRAARTIRPWRPVRHGRQGRGGSNAILQNVRITADVTNNAVLVYADQESQRIVEQTIHQIDRPQRQIAIEATIAEVTLNDS